MCKLLLSCAAAVTLAAALGGCHDTIGSSPAVTMAIHAPRADDNFGGILKKK